MKKVILILFLLYSGTAAGQGVNYGLSAGYLDYKFGNDPAGVYNHGSVCGGVCVQYFFKDSLFGIEGNLLLYTDPPVYGSSTDALAPYFFINVAPSNPISLEIKLGLLGSHTFATSTPPLNDIGPSFGFYLYYVKPHIPEMGLDLSVFLGQAYYNLQESGTTYASEVITINLSFKILVP
jgi:hypothetical protein